MKTKASFCIGLLYAVCLTIVFAQPTGGKGPAGPAAGPRRGGMMRDMMFVERSWAALCFEINISNEQISKLKPTFVWAYQTRNNALKAAWEKHDFQAAAQTMAQVRKTLEERIPTVLTAAQKKAWQKWQKEQEQIMNRMRAGGRGRQGQGPAGPQKAK